MNISKISFGLVFVVAIWHCAFTWDAEFLLQHILTYHLKIPARDIVWFVSEKLDTENSKNFQEFFNSLHRKISVPQMVFTNDEGISVEGTLSNSYCMGIVMTTGPEDHIMQVHKRVLKGHRNHVNFIILARPLEDFQVAYRLLRNLSENNFRNSFLYVKYLNDSSDLLGFNQYPNFSIESRNDLEMYSDKMIRKMMYGFTNYHGFEFRTPLRLDLPGVFIYVDKNKGEQGKGVAYLLFSLFIETVNASIGAYPMPVDKLGGMVVNMNDVLDLVRSKKILFTPHAYVLFRPDKDLDKSPPLLLSRWCLMVPTRNTVSTFYYPVKPFDAYVWYMVVVSYVVLAITDVFWILWERKKNRDQKFNLILEISTSVTDNICFLLNITASKKIKRPARIKFLLYATVFFHAFFLSVSYTSLLGSILTVTLFQQNINTMDDLIRANLSTMIIDYELKFLRTLSFDLPDAFNNLLKPVDLAIYHLHTSALDQSYAYFVTEEKWFILRRQQERLNPELFKLTDICFGSFHFGYPLEKDSPLTRDLEYFILYVSSAGLIDHFAQISFEYAVRAGYVRHFTATKEFQAAGLRHVAMIFAVLLVVYMFCTIIFLAECLHYKMNKKNKN